MAGIEPADLAFAADGTPRSPRYDDVYHSADSGPGQARHVFLGGNGLPERWSGRRAFTILELGFGLGVNFLTTWKLWRETSDRPAQLHYVAIDRHPPRREDLAAALAGYDGLRELARALVDRFPPPLAGTHARTFDDGHVLLTLVFDDVGPALRKLDASADAIFLDGFAPSRNPEMWSAAVLRGVALHAKPGATCATWSTARAVREALGEAGFVVERRDGFGAKREMLAGRHEPRGRTRAVEDPALRQERHAIVIGAGLAGSAAAAHLAMRGWRITLVDAASAPASGASSLHAGTFHPVVTRDDSLLARLSRAAFLHALDQWHELARRGHAIAWDRCGVLQLIRRHVDDDIVREAVEAQGWPASYVEAIDALEGSKRAALAVERPGAWFPAAGWARASTIVAAGVREAMRDPASCFVGDCRIASLERIDERWIARDDRGASVAEAPVVVLANAGDLARLSPIGAPLASVRGQVSYLPATAVDAPRAVVIGHGFVLPQVDGIVVVGSSYEMGSTERDETLLAHEGNLARLRGLSPSLRVDVA
ncbi:MAG: FAD-dependent 5-carboxymethylaminomethyl-2-thiouridine(34) oxidoreductase MnmC, partial [Betaproteobacteria bacterium]